MPECIPPSWGKIDTVARWIQVVVSIYGCEGHPISHRYYIRCISRPPAHVNPVQSRFAVDYECRILHRHPSSCWNNQHFNSQTDSLVVVRQDVELFQAHPKVSSGITESVLILSPSTIERYQGVDILLEYDPVVDRDDAGRRSEGRNRNVDCCVVSHEIWNSNNRIWIVRAWWASWTLTSDSKYGTKWVKVVPDEASLRQDSLRQDSLKQRVAYRAPGFERSFAQNRCKTHWGTSACALASLRQECTSAGPEFIENYMIFGF